MKISADILKTNRQKILRAFPKDISADVDIVADFLLDNNLDVHPIVEQVVLLNGQQLIIPGRVYFQEPVDTTGNTLTDIQQTILNCLYLLHHNGFVRQARLMKLIDDTSPFIAPFVFRLFGEYVVEILFVVDSIITEQTMNNYLRFIRENERLWQRTQSRVINYWNEYYRALPKYKKLDNYIDKQIIDRIKIANAKQEHLQ